MTQVPGLKAAHVIISDECRRNRTEEGAVDEGLRRLRAEYMACVGAWPLSRGVKFHLVLTVEAPGR